MKPDSRLLSLELRIAEAIKKDGLHGATIVIAKPAELLESWGRFIDVYNPSGDTVNKFWENVRKLDKLDAYDAGRCLYALTMAVDSVTATPSAHEAEARLYQLANILGTTVGWARRPSYTRVQHATGEGVLSLFSEPLAYIETIIKAVSSMQHQ